MKITIKGFLIEILKESCTSLTCSQIRDEINIKIAKTNKIRHANFECPSELKAKDGPVSSYLYKLYCEEKVNRSDHYGKLGGYGYMWKENINEKIHSS